MRARLVLTGVVATGTAALAVVAGGAARRGRIFALEGGPQPGLAYSDAVEYLDVK